MSGIGLDQARAVVAGTRAAGREKGLQALSVIVLDAGGHVTAFEREDGASIGRFEIALGKAYGALGLGIDSRRIMERAEAQPSFVASVTAAFGGRLVPVPGGVLIYGDDPAPIGAVGVSGDSSDNDEAAALAGIAAAGLAARVS